MQRVLGGGLRVVELFADLDMDWLPVMDRAGLVTLLPLLALTCVLRDPEITTVKLLVLKMKCNFLADLDSSSCLAVEITAGGS